jgi:hypothetical protein
MLVEEEPDEEEDDDSPSFYKETLEYDDLDEAIADEDRNGSIWIEIWEDEDNFKKYQLVDDKTFMPL